MSALRELALKNGRTVPARLLSMRFARSGGPGGQNVNKLETKVDLRLDLAGAAPFLGDDGVASIRAAYAARLDADGWLQVVCDEHRSRGRNVEAALERLEALLDTALRPKKKRRATKPSRGSVVRRLEGKKRRGDVKEKRGRPRDDG